MHASVCYDVYPAEALVSASGPECEREKFEKPPGNSTNAKTKKERKKQKRRVFACLGVFGVFGVFGGVEIGPLPARAAPPPVRRVW